MGRSVQGGRSPGSTCVLRESPGKSEAPGMGAAGCRWGTLTALQSESPTGKKQIRGNSLPGLPGVGGEYSCWSSSFLKPPHWFLEMSLVTTSPGCWLPAGNPAAEEMGSKVFHKIGLELRRWLHIRHVSEVLAWAAHLLSKWCKWGRKIDIYEWVLWRSLAKCFVA